MMRGAFARSPVTRALRNDIAPAMEKWWKAHKKDDGLVTRHLSPYEVQAIVPWMKEWPSIAFQKVSTTGVWWAFSAGIVIGTVEWTDAASDASEFRNRY